MKKILLYSGLGLALLTTGCAGTVAPHVFQNNYTTPLPKLTLAEYMKNSTNTVEGSAFIRQRGGGMVTCAGNIVSLYSRRSGSSGNAYDDEVQSLWETRGLYTASKAYIDPAYIADKEANRLVYVAASQKTFCDIDGKFRFDNVPNGSFGVKTDVEWSVGNERQGGTVYGKVNIPKGTNNKTYPIVMTR